MATPPSKRKMTRRFHAAGSLSTEMAYTNRLIVPRSRRTT
jgi:hypothetical protein